MSTRTDDNTHRALVFAAEIGNIERRVGRCAVVEIPRDAVAHMRLATRLAGDTEYGRSHPLADAIARADAAFYAVSAELALGPMRRGAAIKVTERLAS